MYGFIHPERQTYRAGSYFRLIKRTIWVEQTERASAKHHLVCRSYADPPSWPKLALTLTPWCTCSNASTYAWWDHADDFVSVRRLSTSRPRNNEQPRGRKEGRMEAKTEGGLLLFDYFIFVAENAMFSVVLQRRRSQSVAQIQAVADSQCF